MFDDPDDFNLLWVERRDTNQQALAHGALAWRNEPRQHFVNDHDWRAVGKISG